MAFTATFILHENCDRCGKFGTDQLPVVELRAGTRRDPHVIYIHVACFNKIAQRLTKKAEKKES